MNISPRNKCNKEVKYISRGDTSYTNLTKDPKLLHLYLAQLQWSLSKFKFTGQLGVQ